MDESSSNESLYVRIKQLEQERDELQKDIEKLCMQQAGPSYIALATQMHFRRTAGLEQEIANLKKKLASWTKENSNLKEELSDAKRIKAYIDQLHKLEVAKNTEAAKQLEYLRGVVTNAFADRDHAIMEAEKAKENEDLMSQKLNEAEKRLHELTAGSIEMQEQLTTLQIKLAKQEQETEVFRKIIDKFYKIRQNACSGSKDEESGGDNRSEDICFDDKCAYLNDDTPEAWSFNVHDDASAASYIAALQEELGTLRGTVDDLQNKLQMGLEIEKHLKKKFSVLEQKKNLSDRLIMDMITSLRECYSWLRIHIIDLLDDGRSYLQSTIASIEEKVMKLSKDTGTAVAAKVTDTSTSNIDQTADFSEDLTRALQEKVSALLLLSQQEERHVSAANVHAAVQETVDELQGTLKQVTAEKVKALMELAVLRQEHQQLLERSKRNLPANSGDRGIFIPARDGRLTSFLKKTSFKRWLGTEATEANSPSVAHSQLSYEGSLTYTSSHSSLKDARLRIENATLKGSMSSLEHFTSGIRKLRHSLMQANDMSSSKDTSSNKSGRLNEIIREAELMKTALGSSLPLSWSGEGDMASSSDVIFDKDSNVEKIDSVSAARFEMVELLILAAEIIKEKVPKSDPRTEISLRLRHSKNKTN